MEKIETEFIAMARKKLANAARDSRLYIVMSDMLTDCMLSKSYSLARLILEIYQDCDLVEILNRTMEKLVKYAEADSEMLTWLFTKGATGEISAWERAEAFSNWDIVTLRYFLGNIDFDAESFFIDYGEEIWVAVSAKMNAVDYYELLSEYGAKPTDYCLQKALAEYPRTTDVIWLVEHGCDPDSGTEESVWKDEAQSLIANLACAYCYSSNGDKSKQFLTIEKLLEAGANPNTEIISVEWGLRFRGAKNLIDVALFAKKDDLMDLLSNYGAKPTPEKERYENYVSKMEKKLGLDHV